MTTWRAWLALLAIPALALLQAESQSQEKTSVQSGVDAAGDPLPAGAVRRMGTAQLRHGSRIMALAYSPNGRILAAGGGDDPVRLWDTDTGKEIRTIKETWVSALAFSPRGSVLAGAGAFKTIRLWEVATGKEYNKLEGHAAAIRALA